MKEKCNQDFRSIPPERSAPLFSPHSLQVVRGKLRQREKPGQLFPGRGAEGSEPWSWAPCGLWPPVPFTRTPTTPQRPLGASEARALQGRSLRPWKSEC